MRMTKAIWVALAAAVCCALAACDARDLETRAPDLSTSPSVTVSESVEVKHPPTLLALLRREGGDCTHWPCDAELTVYADGAYRALSKGEWTHGTFAGTTMFTLREGIERADLLDNRKPYQNCASWVDGQDVVVSYQATPERRITASSCDYDFDGDALVSMLTHLHDTAVSAGEPGKWPAR